jgi:outer membrane protein
MKLIPQLLFATLLTSVSASAQALDLVEIYKLAQQQDAQLKISASQLESVRQALPQAASGKRPQINLSATAAKEDSNTTHPNASDDDKTSLGYSLNLQQALYNSEVSAQASAAEANLEAAQADYQLAQQDLIIRVTEAYFNVLSAQDNVEFAKAEKNAIGRQLEQAQKRFEVGLIAITDVKEAQASFDQAVSQEIIALNTLDNAKEALQLIIGERLSEGLATLGDDLKLTIPEPTDSASWVQRALQNNLGLLSAQSSLKAANENRNIARSGKKPTLNFVASYEDYSIDSDIYGDYDADDLTLALQFDMPLYTGGRTSGAIGQAEADYTTAQNNLLLQKRLVAQQTNTAYLNVVSGIGQVNAFKQALVSTTAALEATEAGFDVGTRTSVDVLNALRETYRARSNLASARHSYLLNTLKLKQAAGTLTEDDLNTVNVWLR